MFAFDTLIAEFCALVNLTDVQHVRDGGAVELNDVLFSFTYDPRAGGNTFFLHVDFGAPPQEREATAYYELLRRNFVIFAGKGPAFTISPVTGHVVYVEQFSLATARAADMAETVVNIVEQAVDWRETRFLSGPYALRMERIEPSEHVAIARN